MTTIDLKAQKKILFFLCLLLFMGNTYRAKSSEKTAKSNLKKQLQHSGKQYMNCLQRVNGDLKSGKINPHIAKKGLLLCSEKYPSPMLYRQCKKKQLKTHANPSKPKNSSSECKAIALAAAFKHDESLPFFIKNSKAYFAGVGMNHKLKWRDLPLPQFSCQNIKGLVNNPEKANFFYFGNHLRWFQNFSPWQPKKFAAQLKPPKTNSIRGHYVAHLGKIFGDYRKNSSLVYFPSAICTLSSQHATQGIYKSLSLHYLIDARNKELTPAVAVASYQDNFQSAASETLIAKLQSMLSEATGESYIISHKKLFSFAATQAITSFDSSGVASNLCKRPRKHKLIAIAQRRSSSPTVQSLTLANIQNLCRFGDLSSKQFNW